MKCPFCNEEINDNAVICSICGEKIPFHIKINLVLNKIFAKITTNLSNNKKNIIFAFTLLIVLFLLIFLICNNLETSDNYEYKSIKVHEDVNTYSSRLSAKEAIDIINEQSDDMLKLLKSFNSKNKKNKVFSLYYENLEYYTEIAALKISMNEEEYLKSQNPTISGIKFEKDKMTEPKSLVINFNKRKETESGYIHFNFDINFDYLYKTYSKYLGKEWKEYLETEKNIHEITDKSDKSYFYYCSDTNVLSKGQLLNWVISYERFLKEYPDFKLNEEIGYRSRDYFGCTIPDKNINANSALIKDYEEFLNKIDKSSKYHEYAENIIKILKNHNYKYSKQLDDYICSTDDLGECGD